MIFFWILTNSCFKQYYIFIFTPLGPYINAQLNLVGLFATIKFLFNPVNRALVTGIVTMVMLMITMTMTVMVNITKQSDNQLKFTPGSYNALLW